MRDTASGQDLTEGIVWKKLLGFFFPILVGLLFQQLYNTADAVILGRFEGDDALAAVGGSAAVIINLIIGFFTGLNGGAAVIIAQRYGAGDDEGLHKVLHTAFLFCCAVGAGVTVLGIVFTPQMLELLGNPKDIMDESVAYLRIYFSGSVPLLVYNLFQGTLQGVGDSGRPLRYLIVSCVLNILLDIVFVAVLHLGVIGAGVASVISMIVCAALAFGHMLRTDGPHRFMPRELRMDTAELKHIVRIGLPSGLQTAMYGLSNTIIQTAVNSFGTPVIAAWTATGRLDGFYWSTVSAFGVAICAFAGQCCGAGKYDRMKQSVRCCMKITLVTTAALSVLLLSIARPVYRTFLNDPQVIDYAIEIMWYFVPFYVIWSYIEVLTGTFRGVGDTLRPMIITMAGTCVLRVLWMIFVVPAWHEIVSVSIIYVISWVITGAAFTVYYFKGNWLKREHGIGDNSGK